MNISILLLLFHVKSKQDVGFVSQNRTSVLTPRLYFLLYFIKLPGKKARVSTRLCYLSLLTGYLLLITFYSLLFTSYLLHFTRLTHYSLRVSFSEFDIVYLFLSRHLPAQT